MFGKNLKKAFSAPYMKQYLLAGVGAAVYTVLPTALKMNGWGALAIGAGATLLLGVWLDSPGLVFGLVGAMAVHLMYVYANPYVKDAVGNYIWRLGGPTAVDAPCPPGTICDSIPQPSGRMAYGMRPTDGPVLPQPGMNRGILPQPGMNDYVSPQGVLSDYVSPQGVLSDYVSPQGVLSDDAGYTSGYGTYDNGYGGGGFVQTGPWDNQ